mmetsp:Transcript_94926/g.204906  ORF Transcript_94926/g.204906 Transcript_94926/m.204906 type:complete len:253 (-) Transcript_94926:328-1086(-)
MALSEGGRKFCSSPPWTGGGGGGGLGSSHSFGIPGISVMARPRGEGWTAPSASSAAAPRGFLGLLRAREGAEGPPPASWPGSRVFSAPLEAPRRPALALAGGPLSACCLASSICSSISRISRCCLLCMSLSSRRFFFVLPVSSFSLSTSASAPQRSSTSRLASTLTASNSCRLSCALRSMRWRSRLSFAMCSRTERVSGVSTRRNGVTFCSPPGAASHIVSMPISSSARRLSSSKCSAFRWSSTSASRSQRA